MQLRLKFKKEGPIRFVGHLDLMRTFQKTFRRAGIPIAYSEGFNPHQIFSFATALAVGVSSEGEYVDLKMTREVTVDFVIEAVNKVTPPGITFVDGVVLPEKEPKAMAALTAAAYRITQHKPFITQAMVDHMLNHDTILVKKKNKKGRVNDFDLKPGIFSMTVEGNEIHMMIANGSQMNIKPEMILKLMCEKEGNTYDRGDFSFHRIDLYHDTEIGRVPLLQPLKG